MIKYVNGEYITMTDEEVAAYEKKQREFEIYQKSKPMSVEEISSIFIAQNINTIITDDAVASRAVAFHPEMKYDGSLISAKTRINWNGQLKRAAVDVWDTETNNPDNAPTLWEDVNYRSGYRVIPETITATLAFAKGEYGWWEDALYCSKTDGNVYTPAVYPDNWELV